MENKSTKFSETEIGRMTNKYSMNTYILTGQRSYSIGDIMRIDIESGFMYRAIIRNVYNSDSAYFSYNIEEKKIKQVIYDNNVVKSITLYEYDKYLEIIEKYINNNF